MFRFGISAFALNLLLLVGAATMCPEARAELSRKQLREIESVFLPAYQQGETLSIIESLDRLMRQMSDEQAAEFDRMLGQQQIPKSTHVMVRARMEVAQMQLDPRKKLPRPSWQELALTVSESESQIAAITDQVAAHEDLLKASTEEGTFDQFESLIWDAHVLEQKLGSTIKLAKYLASMVEGKQHLAKRDLEPHQRTLLNRDFSNLEKQLMDTLAGVRERDLIARVKRLTHARKILDTTSELKDRYLAAWSIDFDGPLVMEELQRPSEEINFHSDMLNDEQLLAQVEETIEAGIASAGESLLTKSRHLFTGLHWWTRGRYGMGPDGMGLLKDAQAVTSDSALFPLLMPEKMPAAQPPQEEWFGGTPEYDRRHQFIWAWEYRETTVSINKRSKTLSSKFIDSRVASETQLSRFY